jgi:SNF family Na+-dependent transporter
MSQYWFKPKDRGYGNVPTTWQGWALTLGFIAFVLAIAMALKGGVLSLLWFGIVLFAATTGFVALAKVKTDGEWRWR